MKGIYLASFIAEHKNHNIVYQDITGKRDIGGDMMDVSLDEYDYIIATPPCNYWSRANYRRETSEYAQTTKHLLGDIIDKLILLNKPFIVENVINRSLMRKHGLLDKNCFIHFHGRHTYWTNVKIDLTNVEQVQDLVYKPLLSGKNKGRLAIRTSRAKRQGGVNVYNVIEAWLDVVKSTLERK